MYIEVKVLKKKNYFVNKNYHDIYVAFPSSKILHLAQNKYFELCKAFDDSNINKY